MMKRIKAMVTGTRWARRPKATWCPKKKKPGRRITTGVRVSDMLDSNAMKHWKGGTYGQWR